MIRPLFFAFFLIHYAVAQNGKHPNKWQTLNGFEPLVIARGGSSGIFPDSSSYAFQNALETSLKDVVLYCDLQLSKDNHGICLTGLNLANSTSVADAFPKGEKDYIVNGEPIRGWFSLDYTIDELSNDVKLVQNIFSRPDSFNGLDMTPVEQVLGLKPPQFWLNVQHPSFYGEHKIDAASFIQNLLRTNPVNYISSPEIDFLKALGTKVMKDKTKLVFRFLEKDVVEPSTKKKYGDVLRDLANIKSFASGILVPKGYIWPVNKGLYLEPATTLVADAHKLGLEVYAYDFANDIPASYNYSYDPTAEYLHFIDNGQFSVDGVITDFPSTASESIACLAHHKKAPRRPGQLIITYNGAIGEYPGCTDIAYEQAINQGADIIDCSVQISKDGVAFCWNSTDLAEGTNALSAFMSRSTTVPEIQKNSGIFSFDLTWTEIQTLKPQMDSPFGSTGLKRNPANNGQGKFMTLSAFLELGKAKAVTGVLINIQNAPYLASNKGVAITDVVSTALKDATFEAQQTQKVLIQSDDTQVLARFKDNKNYQKVFLIKERVSGAPKETADEIRKFADAVTVRRPSVVQSTGSFTTNFTTLIEDMKAANLSVYVYPFRNEFASLLFDFYSDPMVELATYLGSLGVDGVVTEFPATANAYLRSPCSDLNNNASTYTILPIQPGGLLSVVDEGAKPPPEAPAPVLGVQDVADPPLPVPTNKTTSPASPPPEGKSSSDRTTIHLGSYLLGVILASLLHFGF